jgi:hypothetical protein
VRAQISGQPAEPFALPGEEWFEVKDAATLPWAKVLATVASEQQHLSALVADLEAGRTVSPLAGAEHFGLVLGVTCHAIYHAGQVQLIKRLRGEA